MLNQKKQSKRVIAILTLLLLTLTQFLPIAGSVVLAVDNLEDAVTVMGYFSSESVEKADSLVCDVNENSLTVNFEIGLKKNGYLKSGVLSFKNYLNFEIEEKDDIQIKDNELKLKTIGKDKTELISIPIKFKREDVLDLAYLKNINKIVFSGVYVDNNAEEHRIEKEMDLELSWKEETSTIIESEIVKNIDFNLENMSGKIIQTVVRVHGENGNNNIPLRGSMLKIAIPQIDGMVLHEFKVNADKLAYTQGREDYEIDFSDENYDMNDYNELVINVQNSAEEGKVYNSYGEDVYTITYTYLGETTTENQIIDLYIDCVLNNYSDFEEVNSGSVQHELDSTLGNTVEYTKEEKETDISKGYLIANSEADRYEITYDKKDVLNINRADLLECLEITDKEEYFVSKIDESAYSTQNENSVMSFYKTTEFSKENLVSVLGEEGKIQVLNLGDELIGEFSLKDEANEDGSFKLEYEEPISKIKIRTSKPINDGCISILNKKTIKRLDYSRDIIRDFYKLVNVSEGFAIYPDGTMDSLGEATSVINIRDTKSSAILEIGQTELSTTVKNEGINFKIRLNNNEDTSDLYENPVFEIRLPKAIREIKIRNIDLFYTNGELEVANVENFEDEGFIIIRITLNGFQTSYNLNKETNGTIISFDVDMGIDEFTGNITEYAELCYYNANSTSYESEIDWNMYIPSDGIAYPKNGSFVVPISYKAPEGLLNGQTTETIEENAEPKHIEVAPIDSAENNTSRVTSVNQGAQAELIEENAPAKLATMYISVMNNTSSRYSDFQILGRLPFAGNRDILTGRDLGTTVDTILDSQIVSENDGLLYTVYYSQNGEATNDLYDEQNGWSTDFYKMGAIKSYLILLNSNYVLEPDSSLEFSYDYVIPAGLVAGDEFYGTYATYYEEIPVVEGQAGYSSSSADEIGYRIPNRATLDVSMDLVQDKIYELSDAEFEIFVTNTGDVDASNVNIELPMMNGFLPSYVRAEDGLSAEMDDTHIRIYTDGLDAHEEKRIFVGFNTFRLDKNVEQFKASAVIKADNADMVSTETAEYPVEKAMYSITDAGIDREKVVGVPTNCMTSVVNTSEENLTNFIFTRQFSKEVSVTDIKVEGREDAVIEYDQNIGLLKVALPTFNAGEPIIIKYVVLLNRGDLTGSEFVIDSETTCTSNENNNVVYESKILFYLPDVKIRLLNQNDVGYILEDEKIEYKYEVVNNTKFDMYSLKMMLEKSENIDVDTLDITIDGKTTSIANVSSMDKAIPFGLKKGESAIVTIKAKAKEDGAGTGYTRLRASALNEEFASSINYTVVESISKESNYELTGCAYINDDNEQQYSISGIIVDLYNSETNEKVGSTITDVSGRYAFRELQNGQYYAKFNYDDNNYVLGSKDSETILRNQSSVINVNDSYMTDNISINNRSISNVDLELSDDNIFDMKIDAVVEKMTVQNRAESTSFQQENPKLAKVDIDPKLVDGSKVFIEYKITVKNQGTIPGKVTKIVDYITDGLEFDSCINPDWYMESDGNVYNRSLDRDEIEPGDERVLRLILIKNVTGDNTGLVHNTVEIASAINDKAIPDIDSTPENQLDGEDDLSYADAIIGVSTGLPIGTLPIVIVALIAFIPFVILVWREIEKRRYV